MVFRIWKLGTDFQTIGSGFSKDNGLGSLGSGLFRISDGFHGLGFIRFFNRIMDYRFT